MNKRVMVLGLAATVALTIGCGQQPQTNVDKSISMGAKTEPTQADPDELGTVNYNGIIFDINSGKKVFAKLGEPDEFFEDDKVYEGAIVKYYYYADKDINIITVDDGSKEVISDIVINTDAAQLSKGIRVGDTLQAVKAAYGDPVEETTKDDNNYVAYSNNGCTIWFSFEKNQLSDYMISSDSIALEYNNY